MINVEMRVAWDTKKTAMYYATHYKLRFFNNHKFVMSAWKHLMHELTRPWLLRDFPAGQLFREKQ